jgi:hypothetical protein
MALTSLQHLRLDDNRLAMLPDEVNSTQNVVFVCATGRNLKTVVKLKMHLLTLSGVRKPINRDEM